MTCPCVISGAMLKVVAAYEESHPEARIETETDKPLAMLGAVQEKSEPGVVITIMACAAPGSRLARTITPPLAHVLEPVPVLTTRATIAPSPERVL